MSGINKAIILGYVGKDPESKVLEGGATVTKFSIATSESYKDKSGNKVENTEWHNIVMFGKVAEIAEKYVKKGSLICIEGKIKTRSWEDKDGNKRYMTEIVAHELTLVGGKDKQDNSGGSGAEASPAHIPDQPDNEMPF